MATYSAVVAFIVAPREETALKVEYTAQSHKEAVKAAVRFGHNRAKEFGWTFCCVKVGTFNPQPITPEGYYQQAFGGHFFEWKYDWPGTLEDWIEMKLSKEAS